MTKSISEQTEINSEISISEKNDSLDNIIEALEKLEPIREKIRYVLSSNIDESQYWETYSQSGTVPKEIEERMMAMLEDVTKKNQEVVDLFTGISDENK